MFSSKVRCFTNLGVTRTCTENRVNLLKSENFRTKCDDKTEEELIEEELKELLPNHHVLDFSDLQPQTLSDSAVEVEVETDDKRCGLMTDEELMFVVDLHSKLFKNFIRAEWLIPEPNKHILPDYVSPLMEKYKLARRLMDNHRNYFQYTLDKQLCASLAVLLEVSGKYDSNELRKWQDLWGKSYY